MDSTAPKKKNFIMSVVMPVYNAELFLCEAVDSVINQTLGFEDNIQLIFINDGSTDGSRELCLQYLEEYPDNIIYYEQENGGASSARNKGIEFIEGEYVAFFDSDDKWPSDAFEKAYQFFREHDDEIDVISCRMRFFGYKKGFFGGVDGKFKGGVDRVVDLREEYTALHHGVSSSFIRGTCVKSLRFDSTLSNGDDSKFLNTIILRKLKYGLLGSVKYKYRKHSASSVVSKRYRTRKYYTDIDRTLQYFIDLSTEQYGEVVPFIQYLMSYNIGVRLIRPTEKTVLTEEEFQEYKAKLKYYLRFIDDEIIMATPYMHRSHKIYALSLKYDDLYEKLEVRDGRFYYKDTLVFNPKAINTLKIYSLSVEGDLLRLYGSFDFKVPIDEDCFYFEAGSVKYPVRFDQYHYDVTSVDDTIYTRKGFSVEIPITEETDIQAKVDLDGTPLTLNMRYMKRTFPIGNFRYSYLQRDELIITKSGNTITARKSRRKGKYELKYLLNLIYRKHFSMFFLRLYILFRRWLLRVRGKEIWLFGDRLFLADDNGEFFHDYVQKQNNPKIKSYYLMTKESPDLERMKQKSRCLIYGSPKYKRMCLLAKYVLTSTRRLPTGKYNKFFRDMRFDTIYLKHGIDGTDVSQFVNKLRVNDRVYLASSKGEYDACINGNYGYTEREIKLTGLARDDLLYQVKDESDKVICIAPTWRMYLALPYNKRTQQRAYDAYFKFSDFFKFFNSLINDERLIEVMKRKGYTGVLQLHPNMIEQVGDFEENDVFTLQDTSNKRFVDKYKGVDLVVTDYSSIAFEYALMGKSVVYTQFDKQRFFSTQYKEGQFDFEQEGFGPVCYNLEDTVHSLIELIENDCKMDEKYKKRVDEYFPPFDGKNCERIYDMMMNLETR